MLRAVCKVLGLYPVRANVTVETGVLLARQRVTDLFRGEVNAGGNDAACLKRAEDAEGLRGCVFSFPGLSLPRSFSVP